MVANEEAEKMQWVRLDGLSPWARNARQHSDDSTGKLAAGIRRFGFLVPLTAWRDESRIAAGHGRRLAMLSILREDPAFVPRNAPRGVGPGMVPVMWEDFATEAQFEAFAIADNRQAKNAEDDTDALAIILHEMDIQGAGFDGMGFEDGEVADLLAGLEGDGETEPGEGDDDVPEVAEGEPDSRVGEVYELGPHRLLCGDALDVASVTGLLDGDRAALIFTDPPYGVSFQSGMSQGGTATRFDVLTNDDVILDVAPVVEALLADDAAAFVWTSHHVYPQWRQQFSSIYKGTIVWSKGGGGIGDLRGSYATDYELALFCVRGRPLLRGKRGGAVWSIGKDAASRYEHPTQKPTALAVRACEDFSDMGSEVLDLFGGSGSTLIGAAVAGRRARLVELDPRYCDVIRRRWTKWAREHDRDPGRGALEPVTG